MEEARPWGVTGIAGLLFAAAAAAAVLFILLVISGPGHPAFRRVPADARQMLFVILPLVVVAGVVLGSGLIGLRRWAWAATGLILAVVTAFLLFALGARFRAWRIVGSPVVRDEFLAQTCWTFVGVVVFLYLGTTAVLDAFQIRRRWVARVALVAAVSVATAGLFVNKIPAARWAPSARPA